MSWEQTQLQLQGHRCVVDLSDVTFIDESGERLLRQMRGQGVEFVAAGVETKYLVEHLESTGTQSLRRFMSYLEDRCRSTGED